ncbi:MAG: CBS domain-containing protein, partial [Microcoleaceae cyanobacterium]
MSNLTPDKIFQGQGNASTVQPSMSTITVLIIEDSDTDRATYIRYLHSDVNRNYRTIEAETLEEGIELWESERPNVALVDVSLPDGNGLEFLETIADNYPSDKLPVIVLTGVGDERVAVGAMKLGAADYLVKGDITAAKLRSCVEQVSLRNMMNTQLDLKLAIIRNLLVVSPDTTVSDAITLMSNQTSLPNSVKTADGQKNDRTQQVELSCVLVVENHQFVGILTERDVVRLSCQQQPLNELLISQVMTVDVVTMRESALTSLFSAINLLQQHQIRHLPIVDDRECLVGLVTYESLAQINQLTDILEKRVVCLEAERTKLLESYTAELERKVDREKVLMTVTDHIRSSLDLQDILNTAVGEIRLLLQCHRTVVYQFHPESSYTVVAESVAGGEQSLSDAKFFAKWVTPERMEQYRNGQIQ